MNGCSIVVPVFNEAESLPELTAQIERAMEGRTYELIVVDDGSSDASRDATASLAAERPAIRLLPLGARCGKSAAWSAGFKAARFEAVVTIDADLQNDPADIPALIRKLDEGWDCVGGWRSARKDPARRNIVSRAANRAIGALLGVRFKDLGCGLKAFRRDAVAGLELFKGAHRYVMVILKRRGAKVVEIPVGHRPRAHGRSKYRFRLFETVWVLLKILSSRRAGGRRPA